MSLNYKIWKKICQMYLGEVSTLKVKVQTLETEIGY
jgi:hypothetical protein